MPPSRTTGGLKSAFGVNVGDIVEPGGDLFGDGVNIAARLQGTR